MRIDLEHGGRRRWYAKLGLALAKRIIGITPGPPLAATYRPDLFSKQVRGYTLRAMSRFGVWSRGESELFAAFVSNLNTCQF